MLVSISQSGYRHRELTVVHCVSLNTPVMQIHRLSEGVYVG